MVERILQNKHPVRITSLYSQNIKQDRIKGKVTVDYNSYDIVQYAFLFWPWHLSPSDQRLDEDSIT